MKLDKIDLFTGIIWIVITLIGFFKEGPTTDSFIIAGATLVIWIFILRLNKRGER